jgi:hypothetical protein
MSLRTLWIAGVSALLGLCLAIVTVVTFGWPPELQSASGQVSRAAAGFLGLFLAVVSISFWGLLGVAAWKVVTGKFQGPKNCPHCGATLRE